MDVRLHRSAERALLRAGAWPIPYFENDGPWLKVVWHVPVGGIGFVPMDVEDRWHELHWSAPDNIEDDPYQHMNVSDWEAPRGWSWPQATAGVLRALPRPPVGVEVAGLVETPAVILVDADR